MTDTDIKPYFPCLPPQPPLRATEHCRHYSYQNGPRCAVGEDLSGPGASLPCMPGRPYVPGGTLFICSERENYTAAEKLAWRDHRNERVARMVLILDKVPGTSHTDKGGHWGESGRFTCPACGVGAVIWSRATVNGHLSAVCTTPNCFAVQE